MKITLTKSIVASIIVLSCALTLALDGEIEYVNKQEANIVENAAANDSGRCPPFCE